MVRIPETFSTDGFQPPIAQHQFPARAPRTPQPAERFAGIDAAQHAVASVAGKNLLSQIARVGPQPPLMHAPVRAKCSPASRNFHGTPSAQRASTATPGKQGVNGTSTRHGSLRAHVDSPSAAVDLEILPATKVWGREGGRAALSLLAAKPPQQGFCGQAEPYQSTARFQIEPTPSAAHPFCNMCLMPRSAWRVRASFSISENRT